MTPACSLALHSLSPSVNSQVPSLLPYRYRTADEMNRWRARDPVMRFQSLLVANDWWDPDKEKELRLSLRKEVHDCSGVSSDARSMSMSIFANAGHLCSMPYLDKDSPTYMQ